MNNNLIRFVINLKNASMVNKPFIIARNTKSILDCCRALYREGLIQSFVSTEKEVAIRLRIVDGVCVSSFIRLHSKPTQPKSLGYTELARLNFKRSEAFFTTPVGIRTLTECKQMKIGGFLVFTC
jgi:ribosomal protein S8